MCIMILLSNQEVTSEHHSILFKDCSDFYPQTYDRDDPTRTQSMITIKRKQAANKFTRHSRLTRINLINTKSSIALIWNHQTYQLHMIRLDYDSGMFGNRMLN